MEEQSKKVEESTEDGKKLKAKKVTLIGYIIGAIWQAGWGAFYIVKNISNLNPLVIILFGFSIAACFCPVYFNMFMDKIAKIIELKMGVKSE